MFKRHAIYVTLPDGPLARFGASWLGWDSASGQAVRHPDLGIEVEPLTRTPRKYGLHATIKPPFRLCAGTDAGGLADALAAFCATRPPVTLAGLCLSRLGGFLALMPMGDQTALSALAAAAVQDLDPFRAPPTDAELARRRAASLTTAEVRNLVRWGYPHVLDCFRFHITLTGPLPDDVADHVKATLLPHLAPLLPRPFTVDSLTLCGEDREGRFHAIHRCALTG